MNAATRAFSGRALHRLARPLGLRRARTIEMRPYIRGKFSLRQRLLRMMTFLALAVVAFLYGQRFVGDPRGLFLLIIPLVLLALVVIWALPKETRPPVGPMEFCFFALALVLILWPNYLGMNIPGLPWITLARLFGFPMFLFFMICLSVSADFRKDLGEVLGAAPVIWKVLAAFAGLQLLSLPFSAQIGTSFQKVVIFQIFGTALVFIGAYSATRPGRISVWATLFTLCVVPICMIGIMEGRRQQVLWVGHVPSFLTIDDPIVQRILLPKSRAASGIYRVQGPATTPLGLAEYLALVTPFLIHYMLHARNILIRLGAFVFLPIVLRVIILTDSRLGVVGFALSILFYGLVWGTKRWAHDKTSIAGPALTLSFPALFIVAIAASFTIGRFRQVVWGSGAQQFSDESRKIQVAMGLPKILLRPLGYGYGRAAEVLGFTNLAGVLTIDSYFLALALDLGPLGAVLFVGLFLYAAWRAFFGAIHARTSEEQLLAPLAITFVNFIVIKAIFAQDANHPLVFMMLGLTLALLYKQRRRVVAEAA